jgi:hypothetical protein
VKQDEHDACRQILDYVCKIAVRWVLNGLTKIKPCPLFSMRPPPSLPYLKLMWAVLSVLKFLPISSINIGPLTVFTVTCEVGFLSWDHGNLVSIFNSISPYI